MENDGYSYNELVLKSFGHPQHAGALSVAGPQHIGQAQESAHGSRVILRCHFDGQRISEMRFSAWGCPHFIAAAEMLCAALETRTLAELGTFDIRDIQKVLAVPVEKTGRILTLEDALEALKASLSQAKGR